MPEKKLRRSSWCVVALADLTCFSPGPDKTQICFVDSDGVVNAFRTALWSALTKAQPVLNKLTDHVLACQDRQPRLSANTQLLETTSRPAASTRKRSRSSRPSRDPLLKPLPQPIAPEAQSDTEAVLSSATKKRREQASFVHPPVPATHKRQQHRPLPRVRSSDFSFSDFSFFTSTSADKDQVHSQRSSGARQETEAQISEKVQAPLSQSSSHPSGSVSNLLAAWHRDAFHATSRVEYGPECVCCCTSAHGCAVWKAASRVSAERCCFECDSWARSTLSFYSELSTTKRCWPLTSMQQTNASSLNSALLQ